MGDEIEIRTFKEKLLFYTTAFFILLGTFSMFAFLFLVPFVIEPAFTTIFMQFEEVPALCETFETESYYGAKNCSWSSCREGCTKDIYTCTQIRVNYRLNLYKFKDEFNFTEYHKNLKEAEREIPPVKRTDRYERALRDYEYDAGIDNNNNNNNNNNNVDENNENSPKQMIVHDNDIPLDQTGSITTQLKQISFSDIINSNTNNRNNYNNFDLDPDPDPDTDTDTDTDVDMDPNYNSHNNYIANNNDNDNDLVNDLDDDLNSLGTFVNGDNQVFNEISELNEGLLNNSNYFYVGARLFPNVKGCGYPPMLNCTIWLKRYTKIGIKFPCYYSKVDPGMVISDLDYWQNTLNLIYSMAIPIPSFIISVIYLTYAYFKIYNEDEETAPLDKNAEGMDIDEEAVDESDDAALAANAAGSQTINIGSTTGDSCLDGIVLNGGPGMTTSVSQVGIVTTPSQYIIQSPVGSQLTPNSDMNSFGHQLKVQMADELSRDSLENGVPSTSNSVQGNLSKTMTTSISTPPGPTAAV